MKTQDNLISIYHKGTIYRGIPGTCFETGRGEQVIIPSNNDPYKKWLRKNWKNLRSIAGDAWIWHERKRFRSIYPWWKRLFKSEMKYLIDRLENK